MIKTTKKVSFENRTISPILKKKIINIKYLKNHLINNKPKNSRFINNNLKKKKRNKINLLKDNNIVKYNSVYNLTYNNKYKTNLNLNTFITQQNSEEKKINKLKIDNKIRIYPYKKLLKKLSNKNLTKFINTSSSLYSKQYDKIMNTKSLFSGRQKFFKIKNLIYKFDIRKNIEKNIDYLINEDIESDKVYKTMRLYHNSLKNKVVTNKNFFDKNIMISKSNADIINYCDNYYYMDNIYFYKHNKIYMQNYSALSKKAIKEPFKKNSEKAIHKSHKNIIEGKAVDIRKLVKSCLERFNKIK